MHMKNKFTSMLPLFLALSIFVAICACSSALCVEVTQSMKMLLEKNKALGLNKFPISFWNYTNLKQHGKHMTIAEVESWADAGFTVPQSPSFDPQNKTEKAHIIKLLKWANASGMKMIIPDPRGFANVGPDGKPSVDYAQGIRAAVADFGKYPGLFGFRVGDEPDANMKNAFFECYRIQKEIAPKLHPFANLLPYFPGIESRAGTDTWPNYLDEYAKKSNADLVGYDCYIQMNPGDTGWQDYYRNLRLHREAALRNGVPFWNSVLCAGHNKYRCPNQDEIRWQFNTSIAVGANGIVWFHYYLFEPMANYRLAPVDEQWDKTETYYNIRRVQNAFHRRYGDLFSRLVSTRVSFLNKAYGDGELFTPNDLVKNIESGPNTLMVIGEFIDIKGKRYVMFVNNSMSESDQFVITFHKNDRIFSLDWDGHEYEGGAYCSVGKWSDAEGNHIHSLWLAPGQEAVYRVETTK